MAEIGDIVLRADGLKWIFKENRRWGKYNESVEEVTLKDKEPVLTPKQFKAIKQKRDNKLKKRWDQLDPADGMLAVAKKFDKARKPVRIVDDSADDIHIRQM